MPDFTIAPAAVADAPQVAEIYAHHVLYGTATFEIVPPSAAEIAARMAQVLDSGWPWLVARGRGGVVIGYAYAAQLHSRAGYCFTCENSIYIRQDRLGQGLGGALLAKLLTACRLCGFRQVIAKIAGSEPASRALHARAGFVEAGRLTSVGRKHGQWLDVLIMQRALGEGDTAPPDCEPSEIAV